MMDPTQQQSTVVTTSSTTTTTTINRPPIALNREYLKSIRGILKMVLMGTTLLTYIILAASPCAGLVSRGAYNFFSFVLWTSLICAIWIFVFNLFNLIYYTTYCFIPWPIVELVECSLWLVFMLIAAAVEGGQEATICRISDADDIGPTFATVFGFVLVGILAGETYLAFRNYQNPGSPQVQTQRQQQTENKEVY